MKKTARRKMTAKDASNHAAVFTAMAYLTAAADLLVGVYGWPDEQAAVFVTQLGERAAAKAAIMARQQQEETATREEAN